MEQRLLSVEELAGYLGISPRTIYNRSYKRTSRPFPVSPKRLGKLIRFDRLEIDKWIDAGMPDEWPEAHG
jgi:predicted DNA-binding transcriptional regulator AlpA